MDGRDPDGELVEFRPWSQFEPANTYDWRPYAAAAIVVVVLAAGWVAWQSSRPIPPEMAISATDTTAPGSTSTTVPESIATTVAVPTPALLSEADLMAVAGSSDLAAMSAAEEAVFVHFTTPSSSDGRLGREADPLDSDASPGYVEWARAIDLAVADGESIVTVRFSVLALAETPWRLPIRTVEVTMRPEGNGWTAVGFPRLVDEPNRVEWAVPELGGVPEDLRLRLETAGWEVVGGEEREDGWYVAVADPTGATVMISVDPLIGE